MDCLHAVSVDSSCIWPNPHPTFPQARLSFDAVLLAKISVPGICMESVGYSLAGSRQWGGKSLLIGEGNGWRLYPALRFTKLS